VTWAPFILIFGLFLSVGSDHHQRSAQRARGFVNTAKDLIEKRPEVVQELVDGIARSGPWLDKRKSERADAADLVGRFYLQPEACASLGLTKPLDCVMYTPLALRKPDFDLVRDLMVETGGLPRRIEFTDYADTRSSDAASNQTP
jgi:NitT/TauT family transport system substrate-binding protein